MNDLSLYEIVRPMEKNFPIKISCFTGREPQSLHWHEHTELLYFTSGVYSVFCAGKNHSVTAGDLIVVHSNDLHTVKTLSAGWYYCFRIAPSFFADVHFDNVFFQSKISQDFQIQWFFEQINNETQTLSPGYDLEIKAHVYHLMAYLLRNYKQEILSEKELKKQQEADDRIRRMIQHLTANYNTKLSIPSIAAEFYISENYFYHLFKKETGLSPIAYINQFRTEKAAVLLLSTDLPITDIAAHVGFEDPNYFARTFKKFFGVSPRQYRYKSDSL